MSGSRKLNEEDFNPSEHPRDGGGKFSTSSGSSHTSGYDVTPKSKDEDDPPPGENFFKDKDLGWTPEYMRKTHSDAERHWPDITADDLPVHLQVMNKLSGGMLLRAAQKLQKKNRMAMKAAGNPYYMKGAGSFYAGIDNQPLAPSYKGGEPVYRKENWEGSFSMDIHEAKRRKVTLTQGMVNHYRRMSKDKIFHTCNECDLVIGRYPGAYPKYCPNCGVDLSGQKGYPSNILAKKKDDEPIISETSSLSGRAEALKALEAVCEDVHKALNFSAVPWSPNLKVVQPVHISESGATFAVFAPYEELRNRVVASFDVNEDLSKARVGEIRTKVLETVKKEITARLSTLEAMTKAQIPIPNGDHYTMTGYPGNPFAPGMAGVPVGAGSSPGMMDKEEEPEDKEEVDEASRDEKLSFKPYQTHGRWKAKFFDANGKEKDVYINFEGYYEEDLIQHVKDFFHNAELKESTELDEGFWPSIKLRDLIRALAKLGYQLVHQVGSHMKWVKNGFDPVIVAIHKGQEIGGALMAKIARQVPGLTPALLESVVQEAGALQNMVVGMRGGAEEQASYTSDGAMPTRTHPAEPRIGITPGGADKESIGMAGTDAVGKGTTREDKTEKHTATPVEDVDPAQLEMGITVEMEHTDDPMKASEIAREHLSEDPEYYTHLKAAGLAPELKEEDEKEHQFTCAWCGKKYGKSEIPDSHGICRECMKKQLDAAGIKEQMGSDGGPDGEGSMSTPSPMAGAHIAPPPARKEAEEEDKDETMDGMAWPVDGQGSAGGANGSRVSEGYGDADSDTITKEFYLLARLAKAQKAGDKEKVKELQAQLQAGKVDEYDGQVFDDPHGSAQHETGFEDLNIKKESVTNGEGGDYTDDTELGGRQYRCAVAIIIKDRRYVLMGKANQKDDREDKWCLPGGHMDDSDGSDVQYTACREAYEEMGVEVIPVGNILTNPKKPDVAFVVCIYSSGNICPNEEFSKAKWVPFDSLASQKHLYEPNLSILLSLPPYYIGGAGEIHEVEATESVDIEEVVDALIDGISERGTTAGVLGKKMTGGRPADPDPRTAPGTSMKAPEKEKPLVVPQAKSPTLSKPAVGDEAPEQPAAPLTVPQPPSDEEPGAAGEGDGGEEKPAPKAPPKPGAKPPAPAAQKPPPAGDPTTKVMPPQKQPAPGVKPPVPGESPKGPAKDVPSPDGQVPTPNARNPNGPKQDVAPPGKDAPKGPPKPGEQAPKADGEAPKDSPVQEPVPQPPTSQQPPAATPLPPSLDQVQGQGQTPPMAQGQQGPPSAQQTTPGQPQQPQSPGQQPGQPAQPGVVGQPGQPAQQPKGAVVDMVLGSEELAQAAYDWLMALRISGAFLDGQKVRISAAPHEVDMVQRVAAAYGLELRGLV